jgi:riboflavin biosynthesis pyrimidine reductase
MLGLGLVDQVAMIVAPVLAGGAGPSLEVAGAGRRGFAPRLEEVSTERVGEDVWIEGYVAASSARRRVSAGARS